MAVYFALCTGYTKQLRNISSLAILDSPTTDNTDFFYNTILDETLDLATVKKMTEVYSVKNIEDILAARDAVRALPIETIQLLRTLNTYGSPADLSLFEGSNSCIKG